MIRSISYEETYPIRHKVMWPNESIDFIRVVGDETASHFGYFEKDMLIAVISIFQKEKGFQIRKFACLEAYQNQGIGSALMKSVLDMYSGYIYLNARKEKVDFYKKFGFSCTDEWFIKKEQEYIIMALNKSL